MTRTVACEYVSLTVAQFEREVIVGRLPGAVELGGRDHWCRTQLDSYLDRLAGSSEGDWRKNLPIYQSLNDAPRR
ncbi:hypothetical protein LWE61_15205 [Sphingobium sufflavum]|uniref:hypothetical protein n=1 Tax=Sphingobium sufflavum TaxID=1129547 RepID=UPI001F184267|nr:hypothetical protein [Sphingobium sufflavum]MCE7797897.1 hypothetical protein [Sphingobium sufflavum]